ncbi:hypothetical protein CYMTET_29456 [Cymbomonas tetramitiformis]|uniref:Uncharacterized protein n=1 Tax=Cymbomonas tetramitiformis TaxID=36881 RepID=A0AAE0KUX9_9CHLO|nr:hypothetical protein CYMTET_29456 [Cymbomonas tetramitiformis]
MQGVMKHAACEDYVDLCRALNLTESKLVRNFLAEYSSRNWNQVLKLTLLFGVHCLRARHPSRSVSLDELRLLVKDPQPSLEPGQESLRLPQTEPPHIKQKPSSQWRTGVRTEARVEDEDGARYPQWWWSQSEEEASVRNPDEQPQAKHGHRPWSFAHDDDLHAAENRVPNCRPPAAPMHSFLPAQNSERMVPGCSREAEAHRTDEESMCDSPSWGLQQLPADVLCATRSAAPDVPKSSRISETRKNATSNCSDERGGRAARRPRGSLAHVRQSESIYRAQMKAAKQAARRPHWTFATLATGSDRHSAVVESNRTVAAAAAARATPPPSIDGIVSSFMKNPWMTGFTETGSILEHIQAACA